MPATKDTAGATPRPRSRPVFSRRAAPFAPVALAIAMQAMAPHPPTVELAAKTHACATDLASCPENGCSPANSLHALANSLKRNQLSEAGVTPTVLTFADFHALQDQALRLVGDTAGDLTQAQRDQLHNLPVSNGQVSEGDLVQVMGFVVGGPHPNTGESVNCNLHGEENNDFHIPIAEEAQSSFSSIQDAEFSAFVAEMIPQNRLAGWTLDRLNAERDAERTVLVTGQLFYDNLHHPNGDADHPRAGQPRRFALWEIHPVSSFKVCTLANNGCSPDRPEGWVPLETMKSEEEVDSQ